MPPLTPDSKKYKAIGLLKQSQLKSVSLVEEIESGNRYVAHQLKTPSTLSKEEAATRLAQEAQKLLNVSHPNVPQFMGYLSTATGNWFLFEYLDGYPLSQHKGDTDKVPDEWVLWWFHHVLTTVDQLHQKTVVIGGFEPKHFLVHGDRLYLVHVGILENLFPETLALLRSPERLTFTAPEHRHSIHTSITGDLYSAGALAYWLCTGKAPSFGTRVEEDQVRTAVAQTRKGFPPQVSSLICRLLQFQAANRPQGAPEVLEALTPYVPNLQGTSPPSPVRPYKVRFFGRETSARLTTEAVEMEKKAGPPRPPLLSPEAASAKTPLSVETMRTPSQAASSLDRDTTGRLNQDFSAGVPTGKPKGPAPPPTPLPNPLDVDTARGGALDVRTGRPPTSPAPSGSTFGPRETSIMQRPAAPSPSTFGPRETSITYKPAAPAPQIPADSPSFKVDTARPGRTSSQGAAVPTGPGRTSSGGAEVTRPPRIPSAGVDTDRLQRTASQGGTPETKEEASRPAGPTPFQEFMEDVIWNLFRKNPMVGFSLIIAAFVVIGIVIYLFAPGNQAPVVRNAMTLTAGKMDVKPPSGTYASAAAVTTPGSTISATEHNGQTVLSFGQHSRLLLDEHTTFIFQEWTNNQLKITLLKGHAWVEPGDGESAEVGAGNSSVDCPPDSGAEFTLGESDGETHQPQVKSTQGVLQIRTAKGTTPLPAGNSISLADSQADSSSSPDGSSTTHF